MRTSSAGRWAKRGLCAVAAMFAANVTATSASAQVSYAVDFTGLEVSSVAWLPAARGSLDRPSTPAFRLKAKPVRFDIPIREWSVNQLPEGAASSPAFRPPTFSSPFPPAPRQRGKRSAAYRSAQRVTAAFALGVVGVLAGGLSGFMLESACSCETSGNWGMTGAVIGGGGGAVLGAMLVR